MTFSSTSIGWLAGTATRYKNAYGPFAVVGSMVNEIPNSRWNILAHPFQGLLGCGAIRWIRVAGLAPFAADQMPPGLSLMQCSHLAR